MARALTYEEDQSIVELARELGIKNAQWLRDIIIAESNNEPRAANPRSSAKGLIQFMDATARGLGYASSQDLVDKNPTFVGQIKGPVKAYFMPYMPFNTEESLWLSVFLPAYRHRPLTTGLSDRIRRANPGIDTTGDYIRFVRGQVAKKKKPIPEPIQPPLEDNFISQRLHSLSELFKAVGKEFEALEIHFKKK